MSYLFMLSCPGKPPKCPGKSRRPPKRTLPDVAEPAAGVVTCVRGGEREIGLGADLEPWSGCGTAGAVAGLGERRAGWSARRRLGAPGSGLQVEEKGAGRGISAAEARSGAPVGSGGPGVGRWPWVKPGSACGVTTGEPLGCVGDRRVGDVSNSAHAPAVSVGWRGLARYTDGGGGTGGPLVAEDRASCGASELSGLGLGPGALFEDAGTSGLFPPLSA